MHCLLQYLIYILHVLCKAKKEDSIVQYVKNNVRKKKAKPLLLLLFSLQSTRNYCKLHVDIIFYNVASNLITLPMVFTLPLQLSTLVRVVNHAVYDFCGLQTADSRQQDCKLNETKNSRLTVVCETK